jgi:hypothetical protein
VVLSGREHLDALREKKRQTSSGFDQKSMLVFVEGLQTKTNRKRKPVLKPLGADLVLNCMVLERKTAENLQIYVPICFCVLLGLLQK